MEEKIRYEKILLPLVATTLLLTGCSGSGKLDLPSGGKEVDVSSVEVIAEKCAKTVRTTLDSASSGLGLSFNLYGDVKLQYKSGEKTYHVNVEDFNVDIELTINRFFGRFLSECDAALSIKNLKGKVDIETAAFTMKYELKPVEISAYLKEGFAYLDASNSALKTAVPEILKLVVPSMKEAKIEDINKMIEEYIGSSRKAYVDVAPYLDEIYVPDLPIYEETRAEVVKAAVKNALEAAGKVVVLKNFLTVKTYEDSKWGFKVAADKAGVKEIVEKVTSKEEAEEVMKNVTKADATVVALTDKYSRLESIEAEVAVAASLNGSSTDSKARAKLAFEYGKVVEFPSDLDSYKPFIVQ